MSARAFIVTSVLAAAIACGAGPALAQAAGAYQPPRTADGHPDFQGEWSNQWLTPIEKSLLGADLVVTPERAKMLVNLIRMAAQGLGQAGLDPEAVDPDSSSLAIVKGEHRTRQVVEPADGLLPYTSEAAKAAADRSARMREETEGKYADDPEQRWMWERCLTGMGQAPLMTTWAINMNRRIVQTPGALVIWSEGGGETRIIRIGGRHDPAAMRSLLGDSIGHWDGDTLVVETTGFRADDPARLQVAFRPLLIGPGSKVIERFTRVSATELLYQYTIEDPAIYAKPWLAEYSMMRSTEPMYEFACHEGNYSLPGILQGARMAEKRADEASVAVAAPTSSGGKADR